MGYARCAALSVLLLAGAADATTYLVDQTIGASRVSGAIDTDGRLGRLAEGDITGFALAVARPGDGGAINRANGYFTLFGTGLSATMDALLFDFAGDGFGVFGVRNVTPADPPCAFCFAGTSTTCYGSAASSLAALGPTFPLDARPVPGISRLASTITATGVPEPLVWQTMILGLGLIGGMLRRRPAKAAPATGRTPA